MTDLKRLRTDSEYLISTFSKLMQKNDLIPARLTKITQTATDVRFFKFEVLAPYTLTFKAGQWTNFVIPSELLKNRIEEDIPVAGYSFTSAPGDGKSFELAVRGSADSKHEITRYLHTEIREKDLVLISQGQGKAFHSPGMNSSLVLIGAGIGVTPVISILREVMKSEPKTSVAMLYSARIPEDLVFRAEIEALASQHSNLKTTYFCVSQPELSSQKWNGPVGRIDRKVLESLNLDRSAHYFVIGPIEMIRETVDNLRQLGISESRITSEWW